MKVVKMLLAQGVFLPFTQRQQRPPHPQIWMDDKWTIAIAKVMVLFMVFGISYGLPLMKYNIHRYPESEYESGW